MTTDLRTDDHMLLVLWDVDGTLIHNGGVSKKAYAAGFEALTGRPSMVPVITDGQTDLTIIRSLLVRNHLDPTGDLMERVPDVMQKVLAGLVPELAARGYALPGTREAIDALGHQGDILQSVLTGNIMPNAFIKISTFDLDHGLDFEIGGYGSDSEIRAELVGVARAKAAAKYGVEFDARSTVLIGDTPRDVEAGRLAGAYVVGVATGEYDAGRLYAEGAQVALVDLRDTQAFVSAVLGVRSWVSTRRRATTAPPG